jgi:hypothetical protein
MDNEQFISPVPYGQMKLVGYKNATLISYPDTKLISPYNGVVVFDMTPICDKSIKIKHSFNGVDFYSIFCGVETQRVSYGDRVKQGDIIGKFGEDKIEYFIVDSDDRKKTLSGFFKSGNVKKSETTKSTTTTTTINLQKNNKNPNPFMGLMLSPFSIMTNLGKEVKQDIKNLIKKKEKDEDSLNENILRIKKLMK